MASNAKAKTFVKWLKRGLGILFVLGVLGMLVLAWLPKPVPVDLATVETDTLSVTVDEDGRTRVKDRYVVSAPLGGNLARMEPRPGDHVDEGDILARIVPIAPPLMDARTRAQSEAQVAAARAAQRQARAAIDRARVASEFATREAERQRGLAGQGGASTQAAERAEVEARARREELTSTQFAARVADHQHEMARAALGAIGSQDGEGEQMEVRAPVAGRVLRVIQESEGVIQPGTPLLEVGDPAALEIVVDVLTSDAVDIQPGARVLIERWGGDAALNAHVRVVEPSAFTRLSALGVQEQRVNVIIDLDEPPELWEALGDGYRVEARIIVWEAEDVAKVPASAVFRHGEGWAVYAVEGQIAHLREVEVGRRNGLEVQVLDGLDADATVVVHPSERVVDGVEVVQR